MYNDLYKSRKVSFEYNFVLTKMKVPYVLYRGNSPLKEFSNVQLEAKVSVIGIS